MAPYQIAAFFTWLVIQWKDPYRESYNVWSWSSKEYSLTSYYHRLRLGYCDHSWIFILSAFSLLQVQRSLLYLYCMIINSIAIVLCKNAMIMNRRCMNENVLLPKTIDKVYSNTFFTKITCGIQLLRMLNSLLGGLIINGRLFKMGLFSRGYTYNYDDIYLITTVACV